MGRAASRRDTVVLAAGAVLLLVAAIAISHAGRDLIPLQDEWAVITGRLEWDAGTFLHPLNEHLMVLPIALFKVLFVTVGIGTFWPYRLALTLAHLVCLVLLFLIARRRHGATFALFATLPLLFFGTAALEVLLFPINLGFLGAVTAGLGALLLLDRHNRGGDAGSAALLTVALACTSLGISLVLGVAVEILCGRDRWRRIWVAAVPGVLYALWYVAYNRHPAHQGPLQYASSLGFDFRAMTAAVGGYFGIPLGGYPFGPIIQPLIVPGLTILSLVGIAAVIAVIARGRFTPRAAHLIVVLVTYWLLLGLTRGFTNAPYQPRYLYPATVFGLVLVVELFPVRFKPWLLMWPLAAITCVACALNLYWLHKASTGRRQLAITVAAQLGALDEVRDGVPFDFRPNPVGAPTLPAGAYFAAVDRLGSTPALTPAELAAAPEYARRGADDALIQAFGVRPVADVGQVRSAFEAGRRRSSARPVVGRMVGGTRTAAGQCQAFRPDHGRGEVDATLPPNGVVVEPATGVRITTSLRRLSGAFPAPGPGSTTSGPTFVAAPSGRALDPPWQARFAVTGPILLC